MSTLEELFAPQLGRLDHWYQALQARERVLVVAAACGVIIALWDFLLLRPLEADIRAQEASLVASQEALQSADAEQAMLNTERMTNPNQALQERINAVREQTRGLGEQLVNSSDAWIAPGYMVRALQTILTERPGVRLISLESLPPRQLGLEQPAGAQPAGEEIYEHSVELTLEADYFSLLAYLEALEASRWRFIWDRLAYEVTGYPLARITLRLKTLSASPEVLEIGV